MPMKMAVELDDSRFSRIAACKADRAHRRFCPGRDKTQLLHRRHMAHDRLGKLFFVRGGDSKRGAAAKLLGSFGNDPIVGMAQNQGPPALTKINIRVSVDV